MNWWWILLIVVGVVAVVGGLRNLAYDNLKSRATTYAVDRVQPVADCADFTGAIFATKTHTIVNCTAGVETKSHGVKIGDMVTHGGTKITVHKAPTTKPVSTGGDTRPTGQTGHPGQTLAIEYPNTQHIRIGDTTNTTDPWVRLQYTKSADRDCAHLIWDHVLSVWSVSFESLQANSPFGFKDANVPAVLDTHNHQSVAVYASDRPSRGDGVFALRVKGYALGYNEPTTLFTPTDTPLYLYLREKKVEPNGRSQTAFITTGTEETSFIMTWTAFAGAYLSDAAMTPPSALFFLFENLEPIRHTSWHSGTGCLTPICYDIATYPYDALDDCLSYHDTNF